MAPSADGCKAGSGAKGLDLQVTLGPALIEPFPQHCAQFGGVCADLFENREKITDRLQEFLFGREYVFEKALNDTSAALRNSLVNVGMGDWAETLFGGAPERPAPHSRLLLRRDMPGSHGSGAVLAEVQELEEPPGGGPGPEAVGAELGGYGDVWLSGLHIAKGGEAGEDSDFQITAAVGSHAGLVPQWLDHVDRHLQALEWLASSSGDAESFKRAYLEAFPHLVAFAGGYLDITAATVEKTCLPSGTLQLTLDVPFDTTGATSRYPRLVDLMGLVDPLFMHARHPETGATFMELTSKEGKLRIRLFMRDGRPAWEGDGGGPVAWDKQERFTVDVAIESSFVPLGLSMAAIPLPEMKMRCLLERRGKLRVTCIEAGDPPFKSVAAAAFDIDQLQKMLVESFSLEVEHIAFGHDRWAIRLYNRFLFPSSSVAKLLAQWFRDFAIRQLRELDILNAVADFFRAVGRDAEGISKGHNPM